MGDYGVSRIRKSEMAVIFITIAAFIVGAYFYPQLPERIASHWNAKGEVDGYMAKPMGVFYMPIVIACLAALFMAIPRIDPLKANIEKFINYYDGFIVLLSLFMAATFVHTILWSVGVKISPNVLVPVGLGLLYYYAGIMMEHAKRNWFIGIRTPWTLSSDTVWDKTHQVGAGMFKACGVISLAGVFFGAYAMYFVVGPVLAAALYLIIFSYYAYQKENRSLK